MKPPPLQRIDFGVPLLTGRSRSARDHPHGHASVLPAMWNLLFFEGGRCRVAINGRVHHCRRGDALLYPPGSHLYLLQGSTHQWTHRWVAFARLDRFAGLLDWPCQDTSVARLHVHEAQLRTRLLRLFDELAAAYRGEGPTRRLDYCFTILEQILLWFDTLRPQAAEESVAAGIQELTASLRLQLTRPWTVAEMAERCGWSASHFAHRFRDAMGQSPMRYLEGLRLARARELLTSSDLTVAAIAEQCGYCNVHYFSEVFRRRMRLPPGSYRRRSRHSA